MRLDEDDASPLAAWNRFFWKNPDFNGELATDLRPSRGFYTYYPVERVKPATIVIAAFNGTKEERMGDKKDAFKDQIPFIATMPFGSGKTMYLGSGEFWRLRCSRKAITNGSGSSWPATPRPAPANARSTVNGCWPATFRSAQFSARPR